MALLIRLFGDDSAQNYGEELFKKLFRQHSLPEVNKLSLTLVVQRYLVSAVTCNIVVLRQNLQRKFVKKIRLGLEIIFLSLGRLIQNDQLHQHYQNGLHASTYSGERVIVWATEDKVECLPIVKNIKNKMNSKFMSVINTAVSASMTNYLIRVSKFKKSGGGVNKVVVFRIHSQFQRRY